MTAAPVHAARPVPADSGAVPASAPGKPGSTILDQRRARKRGSALKTVLLLLFGLMATGLTVALIAFLWGYSAVQEHREQTVGKYDQARTIARQQLQSTDAMALEPQSEVTFYDDGCIVKGFARSKTRGRVPIEVSIGIYETKTKSRWIVETVVVDGKRVYAVDYD